MIIKNKYGKIVKISLITKKETPATIKDIVLYFQKEIKDKKLKIDRELPFLFTDDRAILKNIEIKTPEECFNVYHNIINMTELSSKRLLRK